MNENQTARYQMHSLVVFSAGLLATAGLLPLIGVSFAFGLLLVNQELDKFHFIFAGFTFCQVRYLFHDIWLGLGGYFIGENVKLPPYEDYVTEQAFCRS